MKFSNAALFLLTLTLSASSAFASEVAVGSLQIIPQLGKLHPMVLHFPIVLLMLLPPILVLTQFKFGAIWRPIVPYFVHLATLTALPTAIVGLLAASTMSALSDGLIYHRNLTLAATAISVVMSLYLVVKRPNFREKAPFALLALSFLTAGILTLGAHFGAETVHGKTFILFDAPESDADYK